MLAQTPEPPYTAVIFSSTRTDGDHGYAAMAPRWSAWPPSNPATSVSSPPVTTIGVTVSYWRDEAAAQAWKQVAAHLVAQRRAASAGTPTTASGSPPWTATTR